MTEIVDPQLQIRALQELARKLPPGSKTQSRLFWENDHGVAGVTLTTDGNCTVYLFGEERPVETVAEAGELLRRIFADEIACVRAYAKEEFVYGGLAPTNDPSAALQIDGVGSGRASIDCVIVATWSRGTHEETE